MQAPKLIRSLSLFRSRGPRNFDYSPIYYDERKERIERRKKIIAAGAERHKGLTPEQREELHEINAANWRRPYYHRQSYLANVRFFLILLLLCLVFAWVLLQFAF